MLSQLRIAISEIKLIFQPVIKPSKLFKIRDSNDSYKLLLENWDMDTIWLFEEFKMILLNRAGGALGIYPLSKGGLNGTLVDPKLVYMIALQTATSSIILAHNHPSGNLTPSEADKAFTQKIKNAGLYLDMKLNDHIILTGDEYFSFADNGLL